MAEGNPDASDESQPTVKTSPLRLLVLCPSSSTSASNAKSDESTHLPAALEDPPLPQLLIPELLKALTSEHPPQELSSFSGYTSHPPLQLRTQYYNADVSIWVDEIPFNTPELASKSEDKDSDESSDAGDAPNLAEYKSMLLSPEAREVRDVIGGILLTLPLPKPLQKGKTSAIEQEDSLSILQNYEDFISAVTEIRDEIEGERGNDVAGVIVLTAPASSPDKDGKVTQENLDLTVGAWEEGLLERGILGWDVVAWQTPTESIKAIEGDQAEKHDANTHDEQPQASSDDTSEPKETNEYGEKLGISRIIEVLEAVDWFASSASDLNEDFDLGSDDEGPIRFSNGPDDDREIQREIMGLSMAIRYPEYDQSDDDEAKSPGRATTSGSQGLLSGSSKAGPDAFLSNSALRDDFDVDDDTDFQIESLPGLMDRVVSIREQAAGMSEKEREQFAKREVEKIMREL